MTFTPNLSSLRIEYPREDFPVQDLFSGTSVLVNILDSSCRGGVCPPRSTTVLAGPADPAPTGPIAELLSSGRARTLDEALSQLNPADREALRQRWGRALEELESLSHETDARVFYSGLFQIGQRLEDGDQLEQAGAVYSALVAGAGERYGDTEIRRDGEGSASPYPRISVSPSHSLAERAQIRLNAMTGVGDSGERLAFLSRRVATEATRPDMLFAMGAAGTVFRLARFGTAARLAGTLESGFGLRATANTVGFLAETVAFTGVKKMAGAAFGYHQDWTPETVFQEWASGAAMLLGLKVMGGLTNAAVRNSAAVGARHAVPLQRFTEIFAPQLGMLGGIVLGNHLAEFAGLHPHREGDTWLVDGLATLLQFNVAGRLQGSALGENFQRFERRIDFHTEMLTRFVGARSTRPPSTTVEPGRQTRPLLGIFDGMTSSAMPEFVTPEGIRISGSEGPHPYPSPPRGEGHTISLVISPPIEGEGVGIRIVSPSPLGGEGGRRRWTGEGPGSPLTPTLVFMTQNDGRGSSRPPRPRRGAEIHERPTVIFDRPPPSPAPASPLPPPPGPAEGPPLGFFEYFYDPAQVFPIASPHGEHRRVLGRSTRTEAGVFPEDFRQISRKHLDLRVREGRIEIRPHEGSLGIRVNNANLGFNQWYLLQAGDLVEFISEARVDIEQWREAEGRETLVPIRLGELLLRGNSVQVLPTNRPALFRFRSAEVASGEASARPSLIQRWLKSLGEFILPSFAAESERAELPPSDRPPPLPRPALGDPEQFLAALNRLSHQLSSSVNLFDQAFYGPDLQNAPQEVLRSLLTAHRNFFGASDRVRSVPLAATEGRPRRISLIRAPQWEGRVTELLQYFETSLEYLQRERPNSLQLESAQREIGALRDYFQRMYDLLGKYRQHYSNPEDLIFFDAMEEAYRGLRAEGPMRTERVRSATQSLDTVVRHSQRQKWMRDFLAMKPPAMALFNMRIVMGEIKQARGRAVAGSFYRSLASGTIYDGGTRSVRAYFDRETGALLGFADGERESSRALEELGRQAHLEEITLLVGSGQSGRILEVLGIPSTTGESTRAILFWLRGLQVLPEVALGGAGTPRTFWGSTELGTPGHAVYFKLETHPQGRISPEYYWRIRALTPPQTATDGALWRLLTLEKPDHLQDGNPAEDRQLWIHEGFAEGLAVGDWVAVIPATFSTPDR